jgi:hypothetical protein
MLVGAFTGERTGRDGVQRGAGWRRRSAKARARQGRVHAACARARAPVDLSGDLIRLGVHKEVLLPGESRSTQA